VTIVIYVNRYDRYQNERGLRGDERQLKAQAGRANESDQAQWKDRACYGRLIGNWRGNCPATFYTPRPKGYTDYPALSSRDG
jgi:hypothetical protein